jgi:hypothetical protein
MANCGMCIAAGDLLEGYSMDEIATICPGCPEHDPEGLCKCGSGVRCTSPSHPNEFDPPGTEKPYYWIKDPDERLEYMEHAMRMGRL